MKPNHTHQAKPNSGEYIHNPQGHTGLLSVIMLSIEKSRLIKIDKKQPDIRYQVSPVFMGPSGQTNMTYSFQQTLP